jgi:hypothetical protein
MCIVRLVSHIVLVMEVSAEFCATAPPIFTELSFVESIFALIVPVIELFEIVLLLPFTAIPQLIKVSNAVPAVLLGLL